MSEYIHLIGAEQVQSAGSAMRSAAEEMSRAASSVSSTVTFELNRLLDEKLQRFEALVERIEAAAKAATKQERR